jgi:hypothetical protein
MAGGEDGHLAEGVIDFGLGGFLVFHGFGGGNTVWLVLRLMQDLFFEIEGFHSLVVSAFAGLNLKNPILNRADFIITAGHLTESLFDGSLVLVSLDVFASATATAIIALADVEAVCLVDGDDGGLFAFRPVAGLVRDCVFNSEVHGSFGDERYSM